MIKNYEDGANKGDGKVTQLIDPTLRQGLKGKKTS
jgi:hypothetical protein